jgi:hypothetical protein
VNTDRSECVYNTDLFTWRIHKIIIINHEITLLLKTEFGTCGDTWVIEYFEIGFPSGWRHRPTGR